MKIVKKFAFSIICLLLILIFTNFSSDNSKKDVENKVFRVVRNDVSVGFINIEKYSIGNKTTYNLSSEVNARVIVDFKAIGIEKSIYENNRLIFSSVYRKINKSVKLNHSIIFNNGKYLLKGKNLKKELEVKEISQNLIKLYFSEPTKIKRVYSDKYKVMLKISRIGEGAYKIVFPNKSFNIFHYKKGKCVMIDVRGNIFKVKLIPTI